MKTHEATEQAYKNGYEDGKRDAVKHGRWIYGTTNHHEWMKCSECLVSQTLNGCFTYCPNCGARMDGDGNA